jgi:hypothetical protein
MGTHSNLSSRNYHIRHYRHMSQLRTSMRRVALGKVGHGGVTSNRFNIGGVGNRYHAHHADWLRANSEGAAVLSTGGECPTARRDADHPLARTGRAADGPQATRYE